MDNGWLHLLKSGVRAGVRVKSKQNKDATQADKNVAESQAIQGATQEAAA